MTGRITDAINTKGATAFTYPMWAARLSDDDTPPTTREQVQQLLIPLNVIQSAGGQELDSCELAWILQDEDGTGALTERVQPADFTKMVDVLLDNEAADRIHLGDYVTERESVNEDEEALSASSQLRPYHFGNTMAGEVWLNPLTTDQETVKKAIEFNPNIDGVVIGNMSDEMLTDTTANIWIHPHAAHTTKSQAYNGQTPALWTLKEAINAVCWSCNPDETLLENPGSLEVLNDAPTVEAVTLERGRYLPFYLDSLLHPLGYNWFINYASADGVGGATTMSKKKPTIELFKKGAGTEKKLYHQAPGNPLRIEEQNLREYTLNRHIGDMHNAVLVVGDWERREITIELFPGWPESDDDLTAAQLKKSEETSVYQANPTVRRLYVGNEAGSVTGLRITVGAAGDPPDLSSIFTQYTPHRRRIEPPLTYQGQADTKTRRDLFLEIKPNGGEWVPYAGTFAILPDQIGIVFSEDEPPEELMEDGGRVRITGTIAGDYRIEGEATRQSEAVNGRDVWLELDKAAKFAHREVVMSGTWESSLAGDAAGADEKDDTTEITEYAEKLRDESGHAEVDCEFKLPGIHLYYEIGDLLTDIEGRNVSLDQASEGAGTSVYVQITKRTFMWGSGGPVTTLTVDRGTKLVVDEQAAAAEEQQQNERQRADAIAANPKLANYI